jgi:hypothetical protein
MKESPILALCLTIFPGLGHTYALCLWRGLLRGFIFLTLVLLGICFMIIPGVIVWVVCALDAAGRAIQENKNR